MLRQVLPALQILRSGSGGVAPEMNGDPPTGVLGDFRILREVGRGGMGVVYEAEQISLGRRVALKVLPFAATMDPKQLQRFQNEAKAAASLKHEHIVHVYGVGCERGRALLRDGVHRRAHAGGCDYGRGEPADQPAPSATGGVGPNSLPRSLTLPARPNGAHRPDRRSSRPSAPARGREFYRRSPS